MDNKVQLNSTDCSSEIGLK